MDQLASQTVGPEQKTVEQVFHDLNTAAGGLTSEQAKQRLEQYGYNEIAEKSANPLLKFLGYFWGPIPWMIEVAGALSAVLRHWADLVEFPLYRAPQLCLRRFA